MDHPVRRFISDYQTISTKISDCVSIAVIHTSEVGLKFWVDMANLYFPFYLTIVDWQKQFNI